MNNENNNTNQVYPERNLIHAGYEELREHVLCHGETGIGKPMGIGVFFRLGMFGWLEECRKLTILLKDRKKVVNGVRQQNVTEIVLSDIRDQVVNLLSNMILGATA
jgi:hypothetical protein